MTGFARHETSGAWGSLRWELRTVNHRYLEAGFRLPEDLRGAEPLFRQAVAGVLRRGKVDCTAHLKLAADAATELKLNARLLEELLARVQELTKLAARSGAVLAAIDPLDVLRWPGAVQEAERDATQLVEAAHQALIATLQDLEESRAREGARLSESIEQRCTALLQAVDLVTARLPEVQARMRARLEERLAQLQLETASQRIEQELLLLVQKMDVDEELDRLRGHIAEVRKTLLNPEPAGRRLDFLMQELNREANTLSSKSQDLETTRAAVDMKVLIDQMREQIQNIE